MEPYAGTLTGDKEHTFGNFLTAENSNGLHIADLVTLFGLHCEKSVS